MNWLKKKIEQLSAMLNAEDQALETQPAQERVTTDTSLPPKPESAKRPDNAEELKEISIGAITKIVRVLGYGKTVVSALHFHSRFAENSVENVGLAGLLKDNDFINRIKRDFKSKGIRYKDDFEIKLFTESKLVDKVTRVSDGIGVEVLTPHETLKKVRARLVATEGITWEPEYILEPGAKHYYIGRCKDPKIENGPKIHNDIAFVGVEEKNEAVYAVNNYVSRSHAVIVFDDGLGAYKIFRSKFLNNPSHKIKIYNAARNDFNGITLSQAAVPHVLRDGDSITFNDKAVLEFFLLPDNTSTA